MSRRCEECGKNVIVGQGKWVGEKGKYETYRLRHISVVLCEKALRGSPGRLKALATAKERREKAT